MSSNKDFKNLPNNILDMLVDSTLKKHGVKLAPEKIDDKEKEQLKNLVDNLKKSVEELTQDNSEKKK